MNLEATHQVRRSTLRESLVSFAKVVLLLSPAVTLVVVVVTGGLRNLGYRFLFSLWISTVTSTICFWGVHAVSRIEDRIRKLAGRPCLEHGNLWYYALAILILPIGLYASFTTLALLGAKFGFNVHVPDFEDYRTGVFIGMVAAAVFFLFETQRDARLALLNSERARREALNAQLEAQLAALTAQMSPHFLFNSLNTIASLIASDPETAEDLTVDLADLYRSLLAAAKSEVHALSDELRICQTYLAIEKKRFGDRLSSTVVVAEDVDPSKISIPVLVMQPLVENAIKYAIAPRATGGKIAIDVSRDNGTLCIDVSDDGPGLGNAPQTHGTGSGLANIEKRLTLRYSESAALRLHSSASGGLCASMTIPEDQKG